MCVMAEETWVTEYKEYSPGRRMTNNLDRMLSGLKMDTYYHTYVVTVTVRKVGKDAEPDEDGS